MRTVSLELGLVRKTLYIHPLRRELTFTLADGDELKSVTGLQLEFKGENLHFSIDGEDLYEQLNGDSLDVYLSSHYQYEQLDTDD